MEGFVEMNIILDICHVGNMLVGLLLMDTVNYNTEIIAVNYYTAKKQAFDVCWQENNLSII